MPHDRRTFLADSGRLLAGGCASIIPNVVRAADGATLRVVFFGNVLKEVVEDMKKEYRVEPLLAVSKKGKDGKEEVTGLEQLDKADLFIGTTQKRTMPSEEQLAHFRKFHEAGKPIVGYRQATHIFQNWLELDKIVFGAKYGGHHLLGKEAMLKLEIAKGQENHPIIKGIRLPHPTSGSYVYTDLAKDVTLLVSCGLPGDMQPHTWVRENAKTKGRVFYTRYDAKKLASDPVVRQIFLRGVAWALGKDAAKFRAKT